MEKPASAPLRMTPPGLAQERGKRGAHLALSGRCATLGAVRTTDARHMSRFLPMGMLLAVLAGGTGPAQADGFLSCVDHLPLAPGLTVPADSCMNFDTLTGRVALADAHGPVPAAEVRRFYRSVLPAFGWKFRDPELLDAVRAGERLRISIAETDGGEVHVHYALAPLSAGQSTQ